ncbi:hypothetical protein [Atlantibacter subterraneus]|uniref:hypothetical protein n=1 Tax=Atlantibacter subterraneus TaxID=255519 RepID=UPI0022EAFF2D|nr:hypothetical protein [Atlantibacter subterranea]MDA3133443.1 hypothetical protein [Atlantibacter subterranea]
MKFNLRIQDGKKYFNDCLSYYYIGTSNPQSIDRLSSLSPVTIYGGNFKEVKKNMRAEFKKEGTPE